MDRCPCIEVRVAALWRKCGKSATLKILAVYQRHGWTVEVHPLQSPQLVRGSVVVVIMTVDKDTAAGTEFIDRSVIGE